MDALGLASLDHHHVLLELSLQLSNELLTAGAVSAGLRYGAVVRGEEGTELAEVGVGMYMSRGGGEQETSPRWIQRTGQGGCRPSWRR